MDIFETVLPFDARTHRQAATYTDTPDPEHQRTRRVWGVEPIPLDELKAARKAVATDLRWQKETAGILINGMQVATDDRSKTLILGKRAKGRENPDMAFRWKAASGAWVELTGAQIIAIADAVADHVQACFDREGDLHDAIDAAETAEAVLSVDIHAGWP
ncbi:DUF4376 domain-containing protein [Azospirillum melinis]|uniref:DUF4376 domain-containing protein n=1 Tax=Azospirillum melinis TaxID=328839 RepID=A0ABX2KQ81_9PROT|nr:DUF4376 domain-containing protein [Azospirillum melinis]MBP2310158.1 hypothetical protein [Azospirillum melinis]NUB02004.1 DUF4376 domain-containing protein [Azospirillum melinis]